MEDKILNGDHAAFEAKWGDVAPRDRPDWPYPSFDARDWAEAFCEVYPDMDREMMVGWFANAIMRGYDERRPGVPQWFIDQFMQHRHFWAAHEMNIVARKDGKEYALEADWLKEFIRNIVCR